MIYLPRRASETDLTQFNKTNEAQLNNHKVKLDENANAYNKKFHTGGCYGFCYGTWKCIRDYLIYPIVLVCVFIAACTILLPLSIYYTVTSNCRHISHLDNKDIKVFLEVEGKKSRLLSLEQIRIHAKKMREQEKSNARKGCDVCLSLLCPCTGVCTLYNKVKNCLYGIDPSHKLKTFYSQPPSAEELKWLDNRPLELPENQPGNSNNT